MTLRKLLLQMNPVGIKILPYFSLSVFKNPSDKGVHWLCVCGAGGKIHNTSFKQEMSASCMLNLTFITRKSKLQELLMRHILLGVGVCGPCEGQYWRLILVFPLCQSKLPLIDLFECKICTILYSLLVVIMNIAEVLITSR